MTTIKAVKSTKSVRSLKHSPKGRHEVESEEHLEISEVIVNAVNKFECPINVIVCEDSVYDISKLKSPSKTKKAKGVATETSNVETDADDISPKTDKQADVDTEIAADTLIIKAVRDLNNRVVAISLNKYRHQVIPRVVMQVLAVVFPYLNKLHTFKINDCYIDKYTIYELSKLLNVAAVTDVCLDSSFLPEGNYDILLQKMTSLQHLSLKTCKINDDVCKRIISQLQYTQPAERSLLALNLSSNHITDVGAEAIGEVLRNNRCLRYLNLADNQISDKGASHILDVLKDFPLTYDEKMTTKVRHMQYIKNKLVIYNKCLQQLCNKSMADSIGKRSTKKKRLSAISIKSKSTDRKDRRSFPMMEDYFVEKAEMMASELLGPFIHPFNKYQVIVKNGSTHCTGNMVLCYLNLAYNNLSYLSIKKLNDVVDFQRLFRNDNFCGLINVVFEGNNLPENCKEIIAINEHLVQTKKIFTGGKLIGTEKLSARRKSITK